ncbi:MAG: hypothetical protein AAF587_01915 [Bacteroidota bacterium]
MKSICWIFLPLMVLTICMGCQEEPVPQPDPIRTFMLAIVEPEGQLPLDFEADEAIGDFNPETGLLRLQGSSIFNASDKIELTISEVQEGVLGIYSIGRFDNADNVRAEYFDDDHSWDARSTSGTFKITKFEPAASGNSYFLSGTFSFKADADGKLLQVRSGEVENALILQ